MNYLFEIAASVAECCIITWFVGGFLGFKDEKAKLLKSGDIFKGRAFGEDLFIVFYADAYFDPERACYIIGLYHSEMPVFRNGKS